MKKAVVWIVPVVAWMAVSGCFTAGRQKPPRDEVSRTVSLNGLWEVAQGGESPAPQRFDRRVPGPGYLDQAQPPYLAVGYCDSLREQLDVREEPCGWFWYRTTFSMDGALPPSARLVVHKAAFGAAVWINGQYAGFHEPNYTPGVFDFSGRLCRGTNTVLIRIGADPQKSQGISGLEPEFEKEIRDANAPVGLML